MAVEAGGELPAVDEQRDVAVLAQDRERQGQWRVRHVAAADVQQPGDRFRHRQHRCGGALLGQAAPEPGPLRFGALAGIALGMRHHRGERCRRPARPRLVDQICDRLEARSGALGAGAEALNLLRRVQPRVIADHGALPGRAGEPAPGRLVDQMADLEQRGVDLRRRLQGIAAVDEQRGAVAQHDDQARRAGEAGQPGEALPRRRHVFPLILVGARHDEAVDPARRHHLAQPRDTGRARQAGEILARQAVMVAGGHVRPHFLECFGEGRRGRVRDELVPAVADLGGRGQHAGDQIDDAVRIERRARRPQQMRQPAPIRLCRHLRRR